MVSGLVIPEHLEGFPTTHLFILLRGWVRALRFSLRVDVRAQCPPTLLQSSAQSLPPC